MLYYYGTWVEDALCRAHDAVNPDMWFDEPTQARSVCMKCPVKDECLFTALELIQRGELIRGVWGGLSAIQLRRALENPKNIPKMRGQRSRAKQPPIFLIPLVPEPREPEEELPTRRHRSPAGRARASGASAASAQTPEFEIPSIKLEAQQG
jgi:Transcription factor WhiB